MIHVGNVRNAVTDFIRGVCQGREGFSVVRLGSREALQ
jgi:hypothetical protein